MQIQHLENSFVKFCPHLLLNLSFLFLDLLVHRLDRLRFTVWETSYFLSLSLLSIVSSWSLVKVCTEIVLGKARYYFSTCCSLKNLLVCLNDPIKFLLLIDCFYILSYSTSTSATQGRWLFVIALKIILIIRVVVIRLFLLHPSVDSRVLIIVYSWCLYWTILGGQGLTMMLITYFRFPLSYVLHGFHSSFISIKSIIWPSGIYWTFICRIETSYSITIVDCIILWSVCITIDFTDWTQNILTTIIFSIDLFLEVLIEFSLSWHSGLIHSWLIVC